MEPLLELKNVSYAYHTPDGETYALSDLSFQVQSGEFIAVVGPSGCGKSTLLSLISGLLRAESGSVRLNGKAIPNAQSPDIKTLGTVMGQAARKNSAKFQKSLIAKAKRVANPVDKKPAVKSNFQRLQEAKQRNAQVVAAYKSAQNSVSFNQQQITDLRAKLDKETGRLNNEKARNGELKRRLKQLKAGN